MSNFWTHYFVPIVHFSYKSEKSNIILLKNSNLYEKGDAIYEIVKFLQFLGPNIIYLLGF